MTTCRPQPMPNRLSPWTSHHESIHLQTAGCLQFMDLTDRVREAVRRSGVWMGVVNLQTRHTTTAVVINENEPLLLEDMKTVLEQMAPRNRAYCHDNHAARPGIPPDEYTNGHAHCKALFLKTSETLNVVNGSVQLGPWQRIFFLELDCARSRTLSLLVLGLEQSGDSLPR